MYHLNLLKFFPLNFIVPGGKGRRVGVHLKCTKINANSTFKRTLPPQLLRGSKATLSRTSWMYSKCLHARWHRHWCWLGVSLCGSSVRRQEHSGNCELSQTRQSTGFFFKKWSVHSQITIQNDFFGCALLQTKGNVAQGQKKWHHQI